MLTYEDKILQNITKQFDGMSKIDVYDILHKIESLLLDMNTPIAYKAIKKKLENNQLTKHSIAVDKNGYCYLEDHCQFMNVYRIKSVFPNILGGSGLFFTSGKDYRLIPYTNEELQKAFSSTRLEAIVNHFLQHHTAKQRNPKTKRLLLVELFNQIDPYE